MSVERKYPDAPNAEADTTVRSEIIVEVGAEGGSLTIQGKHRSDTGWRFRMVRNEVALSENCIDDSEPNDTADFLEHTDYLDSLSEAFKLLDKYPYWIELFIVEVHPEFVEQVLAEVRSRGKASVESRWRDALKRKRTESEISRCEGDAAVVSESNEHEPNFDDSIPNSSTVQEHAPSEMNAPPSAVGRLLHELSWEGNARKYRRGGPGLENVLTAEVFQALDFLPRTEFLGRIIRSAEGGNPATLKLLAEQVEELTFSFLPGDIDLASDPPKGKGRLHLQPDGTLQSPLVYCMLEAKRIKAGAFQPGQLAREYLAVIQEAGKRPGLLLLVLPAPPPVSVSRCGRMALHEAVANWLPGVADRADAEYSLGDLYSTIDSTLAYTTWRRVYEEVDCARREFSSPDPSVERSVNRLAASVLTAINWHT